MRETIRWITEGHILAHIIIPRSRIETMVTPSHLQLTNGWHPPHVELARALEMGVGWLIGVTFCTFTDPDSPYSRATIRWGITVFICSLEPLFVLFPLLCVCFDVLIFRFPWESASLCNVSDGSFVVYDQEWWPRKLIFGCCIHVILYISQF